MRQIISSRCWMYLCDAEADNMDQQVHTLNISLRDADETNHLIQMLNIPVWCRSRQYGSASPHTEHISVRCRRDESAHPDAERMIYVLQKQISWTIGPYIMNADVVLASMRWYTCGAVVSMLCNGQCTGPTDTPWHISRSENMSLFVRILPSDAGHKFTWSECIHLLHGWAVSNLGILTFCQLYATLRTIMLYHKNKTRK